MIITGVSGRVRMAEALRRFAGLGEEGMVPIAAAAE
ncbi:hypothetical protein ACVJGD_003555 [Bradyrhizobium sp. USDA 10063]